MILDENDAKRLLTKVISYSKADTISASLSGSNSYNIRFALNSASTDGFADELSLSITSDFGKRSGSVSTNKIDDESIKAAVEKSEQVAKLSPENKEFMPPLEAQTYAQSNNYSPSTENFTSESRAGIVLNMLDSAIKSDVTTAGILEDEVEFTSVMNSKGLFAYNKDTMASFSATVRTKTGNGSSRVEKNYVDVDKLSSAALAKHVIDRSKLSVEPAEISPGRYTVILEPAAAADIISLCLNFMNSRGADEGRSFFSKKGGGNKIGDLLAKENVNIYSDPTDEKAPCNVFGRDGYARQRIEWFNNGVLTNLQRNRFWAEKTSQPVIPRPGNVIMQDGSKSLEQIIAECDYAVLVTRFWYIRTVDPSTMLLTGLTRDGVFEIKDGKITRPVKNFRFNESPINVLSNILEIGAGEKATGAETGNMQIFAPVLKVANFNFSSLSDAI